MKKIFKSANALFWATFLFSACGPAVQNAPTPEGTTVVEETGPTVKVDRFISGDAISDLTIGMTIQDVVVKLGSKPHNVFSAQANSHYIYHYRYKLVNMELSAEKQHEKGIEKSPVKYHYYPEIHDLYVMFDGLGKLEYFVTNAGQKLTEKLLRENNMLYVIKNDKRVYEKDTTGLFRSLTSDAFYPLVPCTTCQPVPVKEQKSEVQIIEITESEKPEVVPEPTKAAKKLMNNLLNVN